MDARVQKTITILEQQMTERLTLRALASAAGLSVTQFIRLFRAETGRTPGVYLRDLRMARARVLVEQTSLPITEVMAQVGIYDRSHFARDFRRAHGLSPRMLRIQLRMTKPRQYDSPRC